MRHSFTLGLLLFVLSAARAAAADLAQESSQHGDIEVAVALDAAEQSGSASATIKIHARRDVVWSDHELRGRAALATGSHRL